MKTWQQILIEADAFVKFLSQDSLYAKPYNGGLPEEFVLTDATIARLVASGGLPEGFEDWESLTDSTKTHHWRLEISYLLAYFELNNGNATDYSGFREVGNHVMPKAICGGSISVQYQEQIVPATVVTDMSGDSAHDYFSKRGHEARQLLMRFISSRIANDCIISCLALCIDNNHKPVFPDRYQKISLARLSDFFSDKTQFERGLQITKT
ncbi:hypothetical protein Ddc_23282 [Ditylenchus destructor]|nr:hypothetical protein Ddc_23282 [Ditylenchus destructor]